MIEEIHNTSTYQKVYNRFSEIFIDAYCGYKYSGMTTQEALTGAKMQVQIRVSLELNGTRLNHNLVVKAYENIKSDSELIRKAIQYYQGIT